MPYILGPAAPASIYACYGDVWFSRNGGASWRNASKGTLGPSRECRQIAISPADPKTIYVVKEAEIDLRHRPGEGDARPPFLGGGGVFRSTDGGVTWHSITNNLPLGEAAVSNLSVSPTDARRVWVTFQGYKTDAKVFMTTDGGSTWINISSELPNIPAHCVAAAPGPANPVYVGMDDGVYYRDDTLGRWVSFKDGLPDQSNGRPISVTSLLIQEAQHRLVASTFAVGVWMSDLHR